MILELVLFDNPPGLARQAELEGARAVLAHWRANPDLLRKHFMRTEDGRSGGAVYIWKSREAAEMAHGPEWRAAVRARTGSEPRCSYFDLLMILDNEAGRVEEFA
ncbi:MAG TPA: hypothetical protein VG900_14240 [Hyphomicrobiaceae bacterium]|jgi:hypothetical protein|nr:hypothetical protein [Hyphomicrobiaceae bacterium]